VHHSRTRANQITGLSIGVGFVIDRRGHGSIISLDAAHFFKDDVGRIAYSW